YELADYAAKLGAEVVLVSGPTSLLVSDKTIKKFAVATAIEMNKVVLAHFETSDIFIGAAAVADYRPAKVYDQKIKKESLANPNIELKLGH
ncbi:phosphopantothenoylcysteine decarboxylase, partial [Flavobacteriaceae bacterium]|nr:phosphopantothenoylcysteine decarboxylase [Flavobacteriaceae bacterium]